MTQAAFARRIDSDRQTVNRWIRNPDRPPGRDSIQLIAETTGTSAAWLEYEEGDPVSSETSDPRADHSTVPEIHPEFYNRLETILNGLQGQARADAILNVALAIHGEALGARSRAAEKRAEAAAQEARAAVVETELQREILARGAATSRAEEAAARARAEDLGEGVGTQSGSE